MTSDPQNPRRVSQTPARTFLAALIVVAAAVAGLAQTYQKPPQAVLDVLNAPVPPQAAMSPTRDYLLLAQGVRYPPLSELAEPMLRLAGLRINPNTSGPHRERQRKLTNLPRLFHRQARKSP